MPIDSSIYQSIKPAQFESPMNNLANVLKLQELQQSGQFNALKMQEAQQGIERQNNLRSILSGVQTNERPDDVAGRLLRGGHLKEASEYQKNNRENAKNEAATAKDMADVVVKRTEWFKNALNGVRTPQDAAGWVQAQYKDQYLAPLFGSLGSSDDAIRGIPQDPAQFNDWLSKQALNMGKFIELNKPSYHTENLGNVSQTTARPGLGGTPTVVSSNTINQSPDNLATTTTSAANNAATIQRMQEEGRLNRGVQIRGQDLVNARAKDTNRQTDIPKLKQGEIWNPAEQRVDAVKGSDTYIKQSGLHGKDYAALSGIDTKFDNAIDTINKILDPKNKDAFKSNFGGYNALISNKFPGKTQDIRMAIDSLKSNMKNAGLEMMRMGGSIGAMTEKEWPYVEGMISRIDPTLSEGEARAELQKVAAYMEKIKSNARDAYQTEWGNTQYVKRGQPAGNTPSVPKQPSAPQGGWGIKPIP